MATARRLGVSVVVVALLSGTWAADAAAPRKGARYAGKTRQRLPIAFRVSRDGKRLRRLKATVELTCTGGGVTSVRRVTFRQTSSFIRVNRDHTFSGDTRVRGNSGDEVRNGRFAINGRFVSRRRARGSLHQRLRVAGGLRCDSRRTVGFSARTRR